MEGQRHDAHPHLGSEITEDPAPRLAFDGRLDFADELGRTVVLSGDGSRIVAEIGAFGRPKPNLRLIGSTIVLLRRASRALDDGALSLAVTRDGETLFEIGRGVRPSTFARLLGIRRLAFGKKST